MSDFKECRHCGGRAELRDNSCFWLCCSCGGREYEQPSPPVSAWPYGGAPSSGEQAKPSERQVGGDHYKSFAIQPSWFCHVNKLGHMASSVVKYATRAGRKGGASGMRSDIEKIRHYAELWLEYLDTEEKKA